MRKRNSSATLLLMTAGAVCAASTAFGSTPLTTKRVATGLVRPIGVMHAPGDFERVFLIEKQGRIRVLKNGVLLATPFLDIDPIVGGGTSNSSEQGLLGLAFHPDYQSNGYFFVNYTNNSGNTVVARYSVSANPDVADSGSAMAVMTIGQPFSNHNGGWIEFGPFDGYLYIATGDGGSGNDPGNRAQNLNVLLGKMLRIDIDNDDFPADANKNYAIPGDNPFAGGGGLPEIWAYGLRNPWRNSFDPVTGDLYIADVGQSTMEEVNHQPGGSNGGENYGWRCMEGTTCTGLTGCTCNSPALTMPIHTYFRGGSPFRCSITGGEIYRGCAIPDLQGTYFFADYCSAQIWSFRYDGVNVTEFQDRTAELAPGGGLSITDITSFGRDAYGEIYVCDQTSGEVYKIIAAVNGGIVNDFDEDGVVGLSDLSRLLAAFGACVGDPAYDPVVDTDGSGCVDLADLSSLLTNFGCGSAQ